ncbi:MAG: hypothetical protein FJ098_07535, partial [Deltaproteobacteria bacterium]|nr:hypothetical protein [Deltaproteobacteria bacterium]
DGLDNDGDGLVDWPEDPACYRASGASEAGLPDAMAHVAVVQGGRFAYVGDVGLGQVLVVDLDEGRRLDLAGADNPAGDPDPVDSARGVRGFPVTASILDLESLRHTDHGDVVLSTSDGRLTVLRALEGDDAVHTLEVLEQDPGDTQALKPRLFDRDEEIELGFTPPPEYPSLGPLAVVALDEEAERSRFYGLLFSERVEWHRTEVWNITWEGPLPEARDLPAVLRTPARLDLPGADLCAAGVEPGDVAVIRFGEPLACGAFEGLEFEYVVEDAGPDWLLLDAEAGGRQIPDLPEGDELEDDEWTPEWPQASLGMPAPECFQGILRVDVRAAGQFVVRGSRTGFLHPVMSAPEGCIMDGDADPLFTGRAVPATVLPEAALTTCPLTDLVEGLEARTFRNHIFEVDIFPPCKVSGDGGVTILDIPRDVRWSVTVSSGFDLKDLLTGGLPLDLELLPGPELLMLLDPTTRALKAVDPEDLVVDHVYL